MKIKFLSAHLEKSAETIPKMRNANQYSPADKPITVFKMQIYSAA